MRREKTGELWAAKPLTVIFSSFIVVLKKFSCASLMDMQGEHPVFVSDVAETELEGLVSRGGGCEGGRLRW